MFASTAHASELGKEGGSKQAGGNNESLITVPGQSGPGSVPWSGQSTVDLVESLCTKSRLYPRLSNTFGPIRSHYTWLSQGELRQLKIWNAFQGNDILHESRC